MDPIGRRLPSADSFELPTLDEKFEQDNKELAKHEGTVIDLDESSTEAASSLASSGRRENDDDDDDDVSTTKPKLSSYGGVVYDLAEESISDVFQRARRLLRTSEDVYQSTMMYLYAERKLAVFFGIHFVSTMIIWGHFALIKFTEQRGKVPEGAPRYLWKVLSPSLEFGSMHAILFQMALLPVTMSRYSIAALSESVVNKFVPLNRALRMHIHLGYTMISIVFFATIFFFIFFGLICADGDAEFCGKFKSEIMITGYSILSFLLVIGVTSYYRHKMPYEIFYAIHHLVFIMYFVSIAHTVDVEQRKGMKDRSQTFKWFSSTLLFYFCDRIAMRLNSCYSTRLVGSSTILSNNNSKMIVLRMKRPILFQFQPGQYAFLKIGSIDSQWHPFSIASDPESSTLEFFVEVFGKDSWTGQLWKLLIAHQDGNEENTTLRLDIDVMGPYGTGLVKTSDFSHVLAIGAGTGIVPILSLLKQHVRNMLHLDPDSFFRDQSQNESKLRQLTLALEQSKGSLAAKVCRAALDDERHHEAPTETKRERLRKSISATMKLHDTLHNSLDGHNKPFLYELEANSEEMKAQVSLATRALYGVVFLCIAPVYGITILGLTISWNTVPIDELYTSMPGTIQIATWVFHIIFAVVSLFIWDATTVWAYVDASLCFIAPFANLYWNMRYYDAGRLGPSAITLSCLLSGYMTARLWSSAVGPRHNAWQGYIQKRNASTLDRLEVVWTTRSAAQVSRILPDLLRIWRPLVKLWGLKNAREVCRITIQVTDKDVDACNLLRSELDREEEKDNDLDGLHVDFGRLDIADWLETRTVELIESRQCSYSMLAFCGSPKLAQEIHQYKISNDMLKTITGYKHHQMEYISESYGGTPTRPNEEEEEEGQEHRVVVEDDTDNLFEDEEGGHHSSMTFQHDNTTSSSSMRRIRRTNSINFLSRRTSTRYMGNDNSKGLRGRMSMFSPTFASSTLTLSRNNNNGTTALTNSNSGQFFSKSIRNLINRHEKIEHQRLEEDYRHQDGSYSS